VFIGSVGSSLRYPSRSLEGLSISISVRRIPIPLHTCYWLAFRKVAGADLWFVSRRIALGSLSLL
jgi:hypothetical protein